MMDYRNYNYNYNQIFNLKNPKTTKVPLLFFCYFRGIVLGTYKYISLGTNHGIQEVSHGR